MFKCHFVELVFELQTGKVRASIWKISIDEIELWEFKGLNPTLTIYLRHSKTEYGSGFGHSFANNNCRARITRPFTIVPVLAIIWEAVVTITVRFPINLHFL